MIKQKIDFHRDARNKLAKGVHYAGALARVTLGPGGLEVKKSKSYDPESFDMTKDGITALRGLTVEDPTEQLGVAMIVGASSRVNTDVGDNTTTCAVLASEMIKHVSNLLTEDCDINQISAGIEWARNRALSLLNQCAVDVDSTDGIRHVATVAANGDENIGKIIANVHQKIGNGSIAVELSNSTETDYAIVDGFEFDAGAISPYFITNHKKQTCELDKPLVLVSEEKISALEPLLPLLQHVASTGSSLLVIAEDVEGEALSTFIINKLKVGFKVAAIKAPGYGARKTALLQDIAALTGAKVISSTLGNQLKDAQNYLGKATSVKIEKDKTSLINLDADKTAVEARCAQIQDELLTSTSEYDRKQLQERHDKLKFGAALIRVGGVNEEFMKAHRDLVEDAVLAVKAAVAEGIIAGGGSTYTAIATRLALESETLSSDTQRYLAARAFITALEQIEDAILTNAIQSTRRVAGIRTELENKRNGVCCANACTAAAGSSTTTSVRSHAQIGYDARRKVHCDDMIAHGVIDSKRGARRCIEEAAAQAISFVRTGATIVELPEKKQDSHQDSMGM
jgi:chaperonin GroEL